MDTNERPNDLLVLKDAVKLVPSPYGGGRGVHLNTFRRWVLTGRIRHWRNGPWIMVSQADVLALAVPVAKPEPPKPQPASPVNVPSPAEAREILRRHGLHR